jgi:hypothetical protein
MRRLFRVKQKLLLAILGVIIFSNICGSVVQAATTVACADKMLADPVVKAALDDAWEDSLVSDKDKRHEEGGWILQNIETGELTTVRVASGTRDRLNLGIPPIKQGWRVVGFFHTHPSPPTDEFGTSWEPGPSDIDINAAKLVSLPGLLRNRDDKLSFGPPCPPTPTTTPTKTLTGKWGNNSLGWGFKMNDQGDPDFITGSTWAYSVVLDIKETTQGTFTGTMQRTLKGIIGPVTTIPEIMQQIGSSQTVSVSGTRKDSTIDLNFGNLTLHLFIESDSYGEYLRGDTYFYDTGSPIGQFKGLTDIEPSSGEYITWIYSIDLKRE